MNYTKEDVVTDRKNASKTEKSAKRQQRREARKEVGLKPGDPKVADHKSAKGKKQRYNNGASNIQALSVTAHKKKSKLGKNGETGGRMKGSTDTTKRKPRSK